LSFFGSLVPLHVSAADGAMACCVGKAGHCDSGLMAKQPAKPAPKPDPDDPMCGLKPAAGDDGKVKAEDAKLTDPIDVAAKATTDRLTGDEITVLAAPSEVIESVRTAESQDATKSSQPNAPGSLQGASLTKPCPADCRASTGVVRQPRPREIALLAKNSRESLPERANWQPHSLETNLAASATLKCSRPRGPPSSS
jgi:hypothetical protein